MSKRNLLIIIVGAIVLLAILGGAAFLVGKKATTVPADSPTPTPEASADPLLAEVTPTPSTPLVASVCAVNWQNQADQDQDQLPDSVEAIYKTNSNNPDTDEDTYKDGEEVKNGYDPLKTGSAKLDSDNDGLLDHDECKWNTDPFNPDTDGDTYKDGEEVKNGYDPLIPGSAKLGSTTTIVIGATPMPGGLTFGNPVATPNSSANPTTNPGQTQPAPAPVNFAKVTRAELNVSKNNSAAAIKTYLATIDQSSPSTVIGDASFADALSSSFNGNGAQLQTILAKLKQYEQNLLKVPTPEAAVNHQILLVSLTRSVNQQLEIIAAASGKDAQKQFTAAVGLQKILADNLNALKTERQKLDTLVK